MKTCTKCGIEKDLSDFSRKGAANNDLRPACKECRAEEHRRYRMNNRQRLRELARDRYGPEQAAKLRTWREANPEKVAEQTRRRYLADPEKMKARSRHWKEANPEKEAARTLSRVERADDAYLRHDVKALRNATPEEIAVYRETLLIKREYQSFKKFLTEIENVIEKTD